MQHCYHVLIETKSNEKIYKLDKKNLDIIYPYLKGAEFLCNGYVLTSNGVKRLLVKESEHTTQDIADKENSKHPDALWICLRKNTVLMDQYMKDITANILRDCRTTLEENNPNKASNSPEHPIDKSRVFIVHGHDEEAKEKAARFVEQLGLEAIILHEQVSSGKTIIEKIEKYSNVGFAIVLYTPCDLGAAKDQINNLHSRARQNVVFEHGYLIGKIGRENVCALTKGEIEKPNDISGIVYIEMDDRGGWKTDIAKEMKESGYDIDLNTIISNI